MHITRGDQQDSQPRAAGRRLIFMIMIMLIILLSVLYYYLIFVFDAKLLSQFYLSMRLK